MLSFWFPHLRPLFDWPARYGPVDLLHQPHDLLQGYYHFLVILKRNIEALSLFEHTTPPHKKIDEPVALLPPRNRWVT